MIVNLMMQNYLYGRFRWPWISELYEYDPVRLSAAGASISVMLNPRKPTFKVTAKDEIARQELHLGARRAVLHHLRRARSSASA